MDLLQEEIEDKRRVKLPHFPYGTGAGSLSCWGSPAGLTASAAGLTAEAATIFRHEPIPILEIRIPALSGVRIIQDVIKTDRDREHPSHQRQLRERELEWRRAHATELRRYENEWVVLEGQEIIAHGANAADVIRQAKSRGVQTPYVFFVESEADDVVRIGL